MQSASSMRLAAFLAIQLNTFKVTRVTPALTQQAPPLTVSSEKMLTQLSVQLHRQFH